MTVVSRKISFAAGLALGLLLGVSVPLSAQGVRNPHGPLAIPCENCHTTTSWSPLRAQPEFDHNRETKFPLRGLHQNVACNSCHVSKVFSQAGKQCADCHADFHRRQLGAQCENCHTVQGWRVAAQAVRDHRNRFPLLGAHAAVACESCHRGAASGMFVGLSTQCFSCHQQQYANARSVDHRAAGFPTSCETCHNVETWQLARFDHNRFTKFTLAGAHTNLACTSCHAGGRYQSTPADCFGCHSADFAKSTNPNHVASGFPRDCASCHTTFTWQGAKFDHGSVTRFALTGAHASIACASCHVGGRFSGTPEACSGCHVADFERTTNPDHRRANFPMQCETCHSTQAWQGARFDHNLSRFSLTGAHVNVTCAQCHLGGKYTGTPTACFECHETSFKTTANPPHVASSFPTDCTLCHTTAQWPGAKFDHNTATKFPLTGKHVGVTCAQCHASGQYATLPTNCVSCHQQDYQNTKSPNHAAAGFPQDCQLCHSTTQWPGAKFDHNTATKFTLTGKHVAATCGQCHTGNRFTGTPVDCGGCHLPDFQKTTNPNHVAAAFPQNCGLCHSTAQWQGAQFDHGKTKFPLTGKHVAATCTQCHASGQYLGLGTQCANCHLKDFQTTKSPNHAAAGFPQDCQLCHSTTQWPGAKFDHNTATKFPLTGKHVGVTCAQCHASGQYATLPTTCVSCHLTKYQATTNPNHVAASFPQDCSLCHNTTQWPGATFNHTTTKFPLTGKHTAVTCAQCHSSGQYATLPTTCVSCHLTKYQATTNPNHVAAGFPQDCSLCHNTTQWPGATFNHSNTRFPLTGKHTSLTCAQCHASGQYATLSTTCVSCHLSKYQATTNPNHAAAGFPTDCAACHTTAQWPGAKFDHNTATRFPLTGKHTTVTCTQCHASGQYASLATTCVSCHLAKYQATTNPSHVAAGFPQDCSLCHNTTQWPGATFNHSTTRFPLTGKHTTLTCMQCHSSGQYATLPTTCVSCHLAKYQATTNPNHVAAGFPQDCSLCHNTTHWPGATFNHSATRFPLTGKHTTLTCAQCHSSGQYATLPTTCVSCHLAKYQATTNPNHVAAGFPQDCSLCHNTTQWPGATFNHSTTAFPLTGKHTTTSCSQCHVNAVYKGTPKDCYSCHSAVYNTTSNPNHIAAGFPRTCDTCHTTTQWPGATFNHTGFPITTGAHKKGTWNTCADCHANSTNYSIFTCTTACHPQATTNNKHSQVRNYIYNSTNCYGCHPSGKAG